MISDGDSVAKNAFRVALLTADDTLLPVNRTQELDPNDILEVRDMAEAIARAEQIVSAPRSSRPAGPSSRGEIRETDIRETDLFESLGRSRTDDTAGPATPAPSASAMHLLRPEATIRPVALTPVPRSTPAHELILSLPTPDEDAYFAPAPRFRSLADQTLDGYRPEPTLLVRARARRRSIKWVTGAILLPLLVLAAVATLGQKDAATPATSTTTIATATMNAAPPIVAAPAPKPVSVPGAAAAPTARPVTTSSSVPAFDVNNLPTAKRASGR